MALPEVLQPLGFLVGTWRGRGQGEFPTAEPFPYDEELEFTHEGGDFLAYRQRSWVPGTGEVLHAEAGFWRRLADGTVEVALAHPFGVTEISEGRLDGEGVQMAAVEVGLSTGGEAVTGLSRVYRVDGATMTYELQMATDSIPLTRHLLGTLTREA